MLRIGDAQIPWTPLLEVAQVMQRAMSLLVSIGRVTTPRTRVPDVVATVGDELGRRQVGGGCDPFTRVGAILSGTGHRVGLLAHSLDPDYTVHAWRGKPGILAIVSDNAKNTFIASDLVVIHDPQPAGLIMNGVIFGNVLWRCHIDTSMPNPTVWRFLLPYINQCAGAIFTMPEFIGSGLQIPAYQIMPCIDPLAEKNQQYTKAQTLDILAPLFQEHNLDPERPILAAISRYDIHKNQATIINAFKRLREVRAYDPPPYLVFLGNMATDDPEGGVMLDTLQEQAGDDPDIKFWVNVENNDQVVGALMHLAQGFVHVSTKEGFGLVVSEALWQGTPVIGSRVGGIQRQVLDGQTGYLVNPMDVDAIAERMSRILDRPEEASVLGSQGQEHVRQHFLLPELVRCYVTLLRFYCGIDQELPQFRLDSLAYSEIIQMLRRQHPDLPSPRNAADALEIV